MAEGSARGIFQRKSAGRLGLFKPAWADDLDDTQV
jgi:hypothetical protein